MWWLRRGLVKFQGKYLEHACVNKLMHYWKDVMLNIHALTLKSVKKNNRAKRGKWSNSEMKEEEEEKRDE